jgi:hypothetical protein
MNTSGRNAMVRSSFFQPSARQPKRACLTGNHNRQLARLLLGRWTIYRNSDALLEAGVLFEATSHVCKNPDCRGPKHYWRNGHWTQVYNISLPMLQNATLLKEKLCSILLHEQCSKTPKSNVAKRDANSGKYPNSPCGGRNRLFGSYEP